MVLNVEILGKISVIRSNENLKIQTQPSTPSFASHTCKLSINAFGQSRIHQTEIVDDMLLLCPVLFI